MSSDPTKTQSPTPADTTAPKRSRKPRLFRRRGRARDDDIEGEDVIERAALSDTESEPSDQDDTASEDEEEEEPPEPVPQASSSSLATATVATLPTPVTETTPPPVKTKDETSAPTTQKEPSQLWSDAVAEDKPGNGEDLPVIDFAELSTVPQGESITSLIDKKKKKKERKKKAKADQSSTPKQETKTGGPSTSASGGPSAAPAPAPADTTAPAQPSTSSTDAPVPESAPAPDSASPPTPSTSKPPKHIPAYITARQSYLKKLSSDPAATPRVGQFWGHDDRLMDKELRPMSDWWRGRGFSRGRGRGGFVGRGRGGRGGHPFAGDQPAESPNEERPVEPIDAKWTHDGYEELERQATSGGREGRRGTGRGRGRARGGGGGGRGGRGGLNGTSGSPASSPNPGVTVVQAQLQAQAAAKMAAEQHEPGPSTPTPSNSGRSAGKKGKKVAKNPRAKVSDIIAQVVKERETEKSKGVVAAAKSEVAAGQQASTSNANGGSVAPSTNGPPTTAANPPRVNLPRGAPHARGQPTAPTPGQVAPAAKATVPAGQEMPTNQAPLPPSAPRQGTQSTVAPGQLAAGQHKRTETLERAILKDSFTKAASSAGASDAVASPSTSQPPVNVNTPLVTQPSGNAGYSYVALPPGIAMGESGLLYEIATGRPVVLNPQAAAPAASTSPLPLPPMSAGGPVYNPRPVPHPHVARSGSMSYIPPHVLNSLGAPSTTPDSYSAIPPTYPGYPGSPVGEQRNGTPTFFAPPKPRGRLSIRAPDSNTSETGGQDTAKQQQQQQTQHQQQAQPQQAQPQPQTTVVPQSTYAPQPQYPASTTHISEAAHAASYAPPPDQYYNNGYYAAAGANPNGYPGVPTVVGGQTYYQGYYPQPYGYGPGGEYGYGPPTDESYAAYGRQQMPSDPNQQQQIQQPHNPSQGYPPMQTAYY